ncbi:MAG: hemerythrin domain-containing protein [Micromonosporaceae bacterium]|nr:hemerythrin domain-containing protein [Micromonosporaceae bacterium]
MTTPEHEDVVDLLEGQHQQLRELFAILMTTPADEREQPFHELVHLLAVHEAAEEQLVHPLARMTPAGDGVVDARLAEEQRAKQALSDLYELGVAHPDFLRELAALRDAVVEHAMLEEREEFPQIRAHVPRPRRQRLAEAVLAAERVAPTRPHPGAGSSMTSNVLLGPPLALFDRLRDAMRDAKSRYQD